MSLYEMLLVMNQKRRRSVQGQPIASKQERQVIEVLNMNLGYEMETVEIAKLAGLTRDSALKILDRLEKTYDIKSRITSPAIDEYKPGKHEKTKVRKWTCYSLIVPRRTK